MSIKGSEDMALDHTHAGGPALAKAYLDIMRGNVVVKRPASRLSEGPFLLAAHDAVVNGSPDSLSPASAAPAQPTTFKQVESVLNKIWYSFEDFVNQSKPAFKPRRVYGSPRDLDSRVYFSWRKWRHRGLDSVAKTAARNARASVRAAEDAFRKDCYSRTGYATTESPIQYHYDQPPTMREGWVVNTDPLTDPRMELMANLLQDFRDKLEIAVQQMHGYIAILDRNTARRQAWFDNAIKLVSTVTALGSALAPL